MIKGKKYRVTYRGPQHKKDRAFVGVYLGIDQFNNQHMFSLRPAAGTTHMPAEYNFTHLPVPGSTPCGEVKP